MNSTASQPTTPLPRSRRALALLCVVVFFAVVNASMINVALPFIGRDFQVTEGVYGWIVTGFSLTFGIFSAIHGRLANNIGLRRHYASGVAILGSTALLLAIVPTIELAIVLRLIQGAGSAAMPALGTVIVARLFPPNRRGAAMGAILASVGVGASIGPFLGGVLVDLGGWRTVFAFTGVVFFALPFVFRLLPAHLDERTPEPFDLPGALLLAVGVSALVYSFTAVERMGLGIEVLGLLLLAAITLGLLIWRCTRVEHPFADPAIFRDLRYSGSAAVAFLINATRFGTIVLVPIFLIEVNQVAATTVGIVLLPGAVFIALLSPLSGRLGDRFGARRPAIVGTLLIIAGNLVTAFTAGGPLVGPTVGMALYGLGFALFQSPTVSAVSTILPRDKAPTGMGVFMMIFFLGGAFGVALSVTVVELQAPGAAGWFGLVQGPGAVYSNGIFALTGLAFVALALSFLVPGKDPGPLRNGA